MVSTPGRAGFVVRQVRRLRREAGQSVALARISFEVGVGVQNCAGPLCRLGSEVPVYVASVPEYVASRHSDLLQGTVGFLFGSAFLAESIFHILRAWRARPASVSLTWADLLLRRVRPTKSLVGEPLLEPPPLKHYEVMLEIFVGIIGLVFAALGVWLLLAGFGIGGPIYTPHAPG